jgi:dUTP pyrophosphatase
MPNAVGFDAYSTIDTTIQPMSITKIPLDIAITPPPGTYVHIMPRSGLATQGVTTFAGVIDPDYRGNITVLLYHSGPQNIRITTGDRVAQLVFLRYSTPQLIVKADLDTTERANQGFGSSGGTPTPIVRNLDASEPVPTVDATTKTPELPMMPYNIHLSQDPFDDIIQIQVNNFGNHATMGMIFHQCPYHQRPQLRDIIPSQPCSRIHKW